MSSLATVQPFHAPELLAPGTVTRPPHIRPADWDRMPWTAKWKATRAEVAFQRRLVEAAPVDDVEAADASRTKHRGPVAVQPHGTYAAYKRHARRHERPCGPCLEARRIYCGGVPDRHVVDAVLVDRFVRDEVDWRALNVEERCEAARRLDAAGVSRTVIRDRTHLNTRTLYDSLREAS